MPRRRAAPRLYLDGKRGQWVIRDGPHFVRTGCAESERAGAEKRLAAYLGQKHRPERSPCPLIADVLHAYASEHLPHTDAAKNSAYNVESLSEWWATKRTDDITAKNCRAYTAAKSPAAARRDLEVLRAALRYWHEQYGPLASLPAVVLPDKPEPRERWLTRVEAARLLRAARHTPHLARFILLGLYTGSRSGTLLALRWDWLDLSAGVMRRRPLGMAESKKRTPPVRLGRRILAHLRRWRRLDPCPLVCHYNGKGVQKMRRSWRTAVRKAKLDAAVTPHTLRHTRATWLMQAGVDLWEAAGHLGMSPETLQRVYGKHSPDFQKRAAEV